jgi:hypothetical protein
VPHTRVLPLSALALVTAKAEVVISDGQPGHGTVWTLFISDVTFLFFPWRHGEQSHIHAHLDRSYSTGLRFTSTGSPASDDT